MNISNLTNYILIQYYKKEILMQALQKKREGFRKEIRKDFFDKYRQQIRKKLFYQPVDSQSLAKIESIFQDIEQFLAQMAFKLGDQISMVKTSASVSDNTATINNVSKCFHQLKLIAPYDYEKVFTKYLSDKNSAQRLMRIFKDLIINELQGGDQIEGPCQEKYSQIVRNITVLEILKFLDIIQFILIPSESLNIVIQGLWTILLDDILFKNFQNFAYLKLTLSIFGKLLEDSKNQNVYRSVLQKGMSSQILNLIQKIKKINAQLELHQNLLILINNYLLCELYYKPEDHQTIGEITINTSAVNQKEIFMAYCIVFLAKHQSSLYSIVFPVISKIIEIHEFLTSQLKDEYLKEICELIYHEDRKIQVEALSLLNDFLYHSQHNTDVLLKNGYILNLLQKRLTIQKTINDKDVNSCVEKISYIICNCLMTQQPKLRKLALNHYIWEDIYISLHPSNKLFPLIVTIMYFLEANGHKRFDQYLIPYLQALRNFQWEMCKYAEDIKKSILRIFHNSNQHWPEHEQEQLLRILYQNGFLELVEDYCEPEVLDRIKEGAMQ